MSVLTAKQQEFKTKTEQAVTLRDKIAEAAAANQPFEDDQKAFDRLMDVEIPALEAEIKRLSKLEEIVPKATSEGDEQPSGRKAVDSAARVTDREDGKTIATIGERLISLGELKKYTKGDRVTAAVEDRKALGFRDLERKATFTQAAAGLTGYDRQPGMVLVEQQRLTIADLLATGQTNENTIRYVREVSYTNAATTVAEGATKPEATFDTEEADAPVRKIAVTAKVTDETFADFPQLRDYVNNRLVFMVQQREEDQILNGDGVAPNLTGILNTTGILTQAMGGDTRLDAIFKAKNKILTQGFYQPNGIVMHPDDYQDIRLLKDANTQYYGGGPFTGPYGNGGIAPDSLWGLPIVVTTAIAAGTALVGAFRLGAQLFFREGIRLETTNSNEDDFKKNLVAIRAEERVALAVYRPKAFCTVTGI